MRMSGTDRLARLPSENLMQYPPDYVIGNVLLVPSALANLNRRAGTYQQVRYKKIVFTITGTSPTSDRGSVKVGFNKDPDDMITSVASLATIPGSKTLKVWETLSMTIPVDKNTWYFTDPGTDQRMYSPGRFYIIVDTPITSSGSNFQHFTVDVAWEVECRSSSLPSSVEESTPWTITALNTISTLSGSSFVYDEDGAITDISRLFDMPEGLVAHLKANPDKSVVFRLGATQTNLDGTGKWYSIRFMNLRWYETDNEIRARLMENPEQLDSGLDVDWAHTMVLCYPGETLSVYQVVVVDPQMGAKLYRFYGDKVVDQEGVKISARSAMCVIHKAIERRQELDRLAAPAQRKMMAVLNTYSIACRSEFGTDL